MDRSNTLLPSELKTRLPRMTGRPWVESKIADWLTGTDRFFLLTGGPGTGKTVVAAAALAVDDRPDNAGHDGVWAASYFCSNSLVGYSYHPRQFVATIQRALVNRFPQAYLKLRPGLAPLIEMKSTVTADSIAGTATGISVAIGNLTAAPLSLRDHFQIAVIEPLSEIEALYGQIRVGVLIDGLDEALAHEGPGIVDLVHEYASSFPRNCRILLTSQNSPRVVDPLLASTTDLVHLDLSDQRHGAAVDGDVRAFARAAVARIASTGVVDGADDAAAEVARFSSGNFLYATTMVREMAAGSRPFLERSDTADLDRYYLSLFGRLRSVVDSRPSDEISWDRDCLPALRVLAVARSALGAEELASLLGTDTEQLWAVLRCVRVLLRSDLDQGSVRLEHQSIAAFLLTPVLSGHLRNPHATDERTAVEHVLDRVVEQLATDRGEPWAGRDEYAVLYTAAHANRLEQLAPGATAAYCRQLDLVGLAHHLASATGLQDSASQAMSSLLLLCRKAAAASSFDDVVREGARSRNPYIRAAVVEGLADVAKADLESTRRLIHLLLVEEDVHTWTTGLYATIRCDPPLRHEIVQWIASNASDELRQCAGYSLYLLAGGNRKLIAHDMLMAVAGEVSLLRFRKSRRVLDFLSNVSITAYINNCDDLEVARATSGLWRYVTVDRLRLDLLNHPALERPLIAVTAHRLASRLVDNALVRDNVGTVNATFREHVPPLIDGLRPGNGLDGLLDALVAGFSAPTLAPRILSGCVVAIQALTDPTGSAARLDELFERSGGAARIWQVAAFAVLIRSTPPVWAARVEAMVERVVTEHRPDLHRYLAGDGAVVDLFSVSLPLARIKNGESMVEPIRRTVQHGDARLVEAALDGLTVVGLYYPDAVLADFAVLLRDIDAESVLPLVLRGLSRMYPMHPTIIDVFLRETGRSMNLDRVQIAQMQFARDCVDVLGLYNNAVHQGAFYPVMRENVLAEGFLSLFGAASTADFVTSYAPKILKLLRDTDYELIRWTR